MTEMFPALNWPKEAKCHRSPVGDFPPASSSTLEPEKTIPGRGPAGSSAQVYVIQGDTRFDWGTQISGNILILDLVFLSLKTMMADLISNNDSSPVSHFLGKLT
ncbi:hypothetical protein CB1_001326011 [Camelus ferus]|nr:hypothetical protein CB1_001326011 [Camelus ferus]